MQPLLYICEEFGCAIVVRENTIFSCPLLENGDMEADEDSDYPVKGLNFSEVTAPELEFINLVNQHFGTTFAESNFAGR